MVGFVDDNNNCVTAEEGTPITMALQESAQKWERLLFASGGTLELSKCFTYVINWEQDEEGRHYMRKERQQISIIESETTENKIIESKETSQSHKTLGCMKNPEMDHKDQAEDIYKKAEKISQLTCSYGLSTETTKMAYSSVYLPAIQYPLVSSHIPKKTLDRIQAKATRRFLPCLGYNPNMPRIVAYAPRQMGGLGMQRLYTSQGVKNTTAMLKHLRA